MTGVQTCALPISERIAVRFERELAGYVRSRVWHRSQQLADEADGTVCLTLDVCVDDALVAWVLGFGAGAQVVAPPHLVQRIAAELDRARARYHAML